MSLALHCLTGKHKGREFPLPDNREVVIGVTADGDFAIDSEQAIQNEAALTAGVHERHIRDLCFGTEKGKGVFINGERIRDSALEEGDRIRMCGISFMLVTLTRFSPAFNTAGTKTELMLKPSAAPTGDQNGAISGTIRKEMTVVDLLQFLTQSGKNGVLTIVAPDETGKICLRHGHIYHATLASRTMLSPIRALYRMLRWKQGAFSLEPPSKHKYPDEIKDGSDSVILEGLRQLDELARLEPDLPPPDARLSLGALRPGKKLRDLAPEDLDLLQLVLEHRQTQAVIDRFDPGDLEASNRIVEMQRLGLIREEQSAAPAAAASATAPASTPAATTGGGGGSGSINALPYSLDH